MNAYLTAGAIALAAPRRRFDLTMVGDDWTTVQHRVRILVKRLRRHGYVWEQAYSVEPNPAGTGQHLHGFQHGDYVPQAALSEAAESAGMGRVVWIEQLRQDGGGTGYGLKGAAGYGLKLVDAEEAMWAFVEANGGRLVHATRGFWRDGQDGSPLTLVEARKRVRPPGEDQGPWRLMRVER